MDHVIRSCKRILAGIALLGIASASVSAETPATNKSIFDLMHYQEVLDVTIMLDLDSIIAGRRSSEEQKTTLSFRDAEGQLRSWDAEVSIRGKFRRVHCTVPPLKLNFKKSQLKEAGLAPFDDFKLVTYCLSDTSLSRQLILKEYLAYRLYNQLTDYSYRVQMLRITYQNPETAREDVQWAFLIEDTAQLRERTGTEKVDDVLVMPVDTFLQENFRMVAAFQYMIGNLDWGIEPTKNLKYVRKDDKIITVPYDFDFSVLVDAPYVQARMNAEPAVAQPILSLGQLAMIEEFGPTLVYFQSKRRVLLSTARRMKLLSSDSRKEVLDYLKAFFEYSGVISTADLGR